MNLREVTQHSVSLLLTALALLTVPAAAQGADTWTDVTNRFISNPSVTASTDGWVVNSQGSTRGISQGVMRFYDCTLEMVQTLHGLPRGRYRLSVQGFYRSSVDSYAAHLDGSEQLSALLVAGPATQPLQSVYSEGFADFVANCQEHDGHYYPNNSGSARTAFDAGMYRQNSLETDAEGTLTIGIRCQANEGGNYCCFGDFRLEYYGDLPDDTGGTPDSEGWTDVTSYLLTNPGFDGNQTTGWTWQNNSSCNVRVECMEFWQGTFNLWQTLSGLAGGRYRLSVQAYYRSAGNNNAYQAYLDGREQQTAYMYAGDSRQPLVSPYTYELPYWSDGCWGPNAGGWWNQQPPYFPNTMETAAIAFADGAYVNTLEFQTGGGDVTIGLRNDNWASDNWTIFDNFRLEYKGDIVKATAISVSLGETALIVGQQVQAVAAITPATALSRRVTWSSDNPAVATVSADGVVTAVGSGTARITARATDGSGVEGQATVSVTKADPTPQSLIINEIMASNVDEFISPALNFDGWVELYNPSDKAVSLAGCYVSNDAQNLTGWQLPTGFLPARGYAVVWFDSNALSPANCPYKLDVDGGAVYISDAAGRLIAQQNYPASSERVSYARTTDGGALWGLCSPATPGSANAAATFADSQLAAPVADQPSQLFTGTLQLQVGIPQGCTLRYTTDGTLPTLDNGDTSADGRFTVTSTANYRFRLFADGQLPSRVTSRSYIYRDRDYTLPVVSVIADPDFLYSPEIGVMAKGPNGRPGNGQDENCNWNMDWERPVNFSMLDAGGAMVLNQDVDLEMCGGWSRAWTPHSFKLKGTKELGGVKYLPYRFFTQKPYIRNRTLQIRNGGNDTSGRFIDPSLQYMVETSGVDIDCQGYEPVHEFVNGQYMGVLNIREPNNKHFIEANYGWDDDEIDQFEMSPDSGYIQKCGTPDAFIHLVDDLSPDAASSSTYEEIGRLLDIDAYANYMAAEFYLGGTDWPQNNVKGFRLRQDGKFRFVLFDLDFAFNTDDPFNLFMSKENYTFDQLRPASLGRIQQQIRFVTLFRNLLRNADFRKRFIDAFCLMGGSVFEASRAGDIIDRLYANVSSPMSLDNKSWNLQNSANTVRNGLNGRLATAVGYLRAYSPLQLSSARQIAATLATDTEGARLLLNGHDIPTAYFNGTLFAPAVIRAEAPEGYTFKGWRSADGTIVSQQQEYDISRQGSVDLTAVYERIDGDAGLKAALAMPVKVNEVSAANTVYVNDNWKRTDWFELYNTTTSRLNLKGLYLSDDSDEPLKFQVKHDTYLPAGGHVVVWADGTGTQTVGGQIHTSFKLGNTDGQQVIVVSSDEFVRNNAAYFNAHAGMKTFADGLTYVRHEGTQSVGRYPDGGRQFYLMDRPTIERTNTVTGLSRATAEDRSLMADLFDSFIMELAQGWNWTSHCLDTAIGTGELSAKALRIVGQTADATRNGQGMTGTLKSMEPGRLYKVQMSGQDTFTSNEKHCDDLPIMLMPGWNWIGYPVNGAQPLAAALATFAAEKGDMVMGQNGFAAYTGDGWKGTLQSVETGKGYMLYTKQTKTLTFSKPALAMNFSRRNAKGRAALDYNIDKYAHPDVMGIIGSLTQADKPVEADRFKLLAYSGDECRGAGTWVDGQVFLTIYGEGGEPLRFFAQDELDGTVYDVSEQLTFAEGVSGTVEQPLTFRIDSAVVVGLDVVSAGDCRSASVEGYYSLGGVLVGSRAASLAKGAYIMKMSDGSHRKVFVK